jgi:hypothetical protein
MGVDRVDAPLQDEAGRQTAPGSVATDRGEQ